MNPFSQPEAEELKLLSHCVDSPRRRITCGVLVAVFKMKLAEGPGMKTVLSPETLDRTRSGLWRCS